jgi:tRNA(adenine34) deaminase
VGAVLVLEDQVLASGFNQPITHSDPSAHAEMMALRSGATKLSNYRLPDTTLYVTLEPCAMCCGAILHARVKRVVFGAFDPKTGTAGSVTNLFALEQINHHTEVHGGVLADECGQVLRHFFKERRA